MKDIARRIAKLELSMAPPRERRLGWRWRSRATFHPPIHFRFGYLRRLPENYQGERHTEIARHLPTINGQEWVEFVEVPGPEPSQPPDPWLPRWIHVVFVEPYPECS